MSQFNCNPRTGHLRNTLRIFMWLKGHISNSKLVRDCRKRDMDQFDFLSTAGPLTIWGGAAEVIP
jgi:hypothetical protein